MEIIDFIYFFFVKSVEKDEKKVSGYYEGRTTLADTIGDIFHVFM